MHKPALVSAPVTDNDGNVGGSLRGDVKARRVLRQIRVRVPANPNVAKLECSCESATHLDSYSVPGPSSTVIVMSKYRVLPGCRI